MITGFVNKQKLNLNFKNVAANSIDYLEALFVFQTADWDGTQKWVHFRKGEEAYDIMLEDDKISAEKHFNLSAGTWDVALSGLEVETGTTRITTLPDKLTIQETIVPPCGGLPAMPISTAEQIAIVAGRADEKADKIVTQAENGDFDGLSAYEVAVKNGFAGTEAEWLTSLEYQHSEEFSQLASQVKQDAENSATSASNAKTSETNAKTSESNAKTSENNSEQAYSDLLKTIGTSIPELVGGKIPMSQIPATATTEIYEVASKDELTSLVAQKGDLAELVEVVNGERTITKTWQLLGEDAKVLENWVVWGTSYAVQSGSASMADNSKDSERINGMRFVTMNYSDFEGAVKDPSTLYAVDMEA